MLSRVTRLRQGRTSGILDASRSWLMLAVACCAGCAAEGPQVAAVTGRVTYQGKPLANAQVVFSPQDGSRIASGTTNENGQFVLGTLEISDGAVVGMHRVAIIARGPDKPLPKGVIGSGLPGGDVQPGDPLIPKKYLSAETSELAREVKAGTNVFDFEL